MKSIHLDHNVSGLLLDIRVDMSSEFAEESLSRVGEPDGPDPQNPQLEFPVTDEAALQTLNHSISDITSASDAFLRWVKGEF